MDMEFNLGVHGVIYPLPAISFRMIVILIYSSLLSYISYISLLQLCEITNTKLHWQVL
jgi:hypothetical protein